MRKINSLVLITLFTLFISSSVYGDVYVYGDHRETDDFIDLSRNISHTGTIYEVLTNGKTSFESRFETKLPPEAVIKMYSDHLRSKGVDAEISRFSNEEPVWRWTGVVAGEKKRLTISYIPRSGKTIVEAVSFENERKSARSFLDEFPEITHLKNNLISSREVFRAGGASGVFVCRNTGSALRELKDKMVGAGWKERSKAGNKNNNRVVKNTHIFRKGAMIAALVPSDIDGESSFTIVIRKEFSAR